MSTVTLFSGVNYTNDSLELQLGMNELPQEWKKKTQSLKVSSNTRVRLYDDRKPSNSIEFTADVPDLTNVRWANKAVKVNVENLDYLDELQTVQPEVVENFNQNMCRNVHNKSSFILILLLGLVIGLLLSKLMEPNRNMFSV